MRKRSGGLHFRPISKADTCAIIYTDCVLNLKRQLTGYGPTTPMAPKLYRGWLTSEHWHKRCLGIYHYHLAQDRRLCNGTPRYILDLYLAAYTDSAMQTGASKSTMPIVSDRVTYKMPFYNWGDSTPG